MAYLLVRHSDAVPADHDLDDFDRYLSGPGRSKARAVGELLSGRVPGIDRVLTSPHTRAVQTAELICAALGFEGVIESCPALSYTSSAARARNWLEQTSGNVACFGHAPTMPELGASLCGGRFMGMSTCQAAWVDAGRALWTADPNALVIRDLR